MGRKGNAVGWDHTLHYRMGNGISHPVEIIIVLVVDYPPELALCKVKVDQRLEAHSTVIARGTGSGLRVCR